MRGGRDLSIVVLFCSISLNLFFLIDKFNPVLAAEMAGGRPVPLNGNAAHEKAVTQDIAKDADSLIQSFQPKGGWGQNLFAGHAGNNTMSPDGGHKDLASYNVAVGERAFVKNQTGYQNVAVGYAALHANTRGQGNVAVGMRALSANTTGIHNVAIGTAALVTHTTGQHNVGIAADTLHYNTTGSHNIAIGYDALYYNDSGNDNTSLGYHSMKASVTGHQNVAIGLKAGFTATPNKSGNNNVWIGSHSGPGTNTPLNNAIAIGDRALNTASHQAVLGNANITSTVLRGAVSAGTAVTVTPRYDEGTTVHRHDYLTLSNPVLANSADVIEASALTFDADPGAHKALDSGSTKTDMNVVAAWVKVNLNGKIGYIPVYAAR